MKKSKLLTPVLAAASLCSLAPIIALTACNKSTTTESEIESAENDVTISGNDIYGIWRFTLKDELKRGQTLSNDLEDTTYFKFSTVKEYDTVEGKIAKVYVLRTDATDDLTESFTQKFDITFTCKNADGSVAWTCKLDKQISVTYAPFITFAGTSKEIIVEELDEGKKSMTFTYKFKLQEELREIGGVQLKLNCWVTNIDTNYWKITQNTTEVSGTDVTVTLSAFKTNSAISVGDYIQPYFQFECVLDETSWWQSNILKGFKVSHDEAEVATSYEDLEITKSGDYEIVTGIKTTANANINTLLIPAKTDEHNIRYVGTGTQLTGMTNITKIKFGGLGVMEIRANAFNNLPKVKCIDVSNLPDTVKSLDKMTMGTDSFAVGSQAGRIIWNNEFSQYKKHLLKEKLYRAGLTNSTWFGIVEVTSLDALREAASVGGYIQLQNDLTISNSDYTGQINFAVSSILDLNGHSITCTKPIYNTNEAETAIIGVWNCELVVTDTSADHNGSIKACQQTNLENTPHPTDGISTDLWENTGTVENPVWHPRETRTFYVRSDVPTKSSAKGTLEILAGQFYGNCTNVFTYNTVCYIEDSFTPEATKAEGTYAPEFHIYTPYFSQPTVASARPSREMLNCKEETFWNGYAYFDIYGGKFFGIQDRTQTETVYDCYNPQIGWGDTKKGGTWSEASSHPNYLTDYKGEYLTYYDYHAEIKGSGANQYYFAWETAK